MERFVRGSASTAHIWIVVGCSLLALGGLLMGLALLRRGSAAPPPQNWETVQLNTAEEASPTPEPGPPASPIVASVNDYTITQQYLNSATALNNVLSRLAGQEPLGETETLQRLIKQQLVLQNTPSETMPSEADIEDYIQRMQDAWDIDIDTLLAELEAAGVDRAFLEETIQRLLAVEAGANWLTAQGHDVNAWLVQQQQEAEITISPDLSDPSGPSSSRPDDPDPTATARTVTPTPEESPTATPGPDARGPHIAANFTLERAGGGSFTLEDQLQEGPVVLVFFERCG